MRLFLLAVVLVVAGATPAAALSGDEPYDALQRGEFKLAAGLFYPLAEKGDARAQYNLGLLHASGLGVGQNYQSALKWHRLEAGQGHAGAAAAISRRHLQAGRREVW